MDDAASKLVAEVKTRGRAVGSNHRVGPISIPLNLGGPRLQGIDHPPYLSRVGRILSRNDLAGIEQVVTPTFDHASINLRAQGRNSRDSLASGSSPLTSPVGDKNGSCRT